MVEKPKTVISTEALRFLTLPFIRPFFRDTLKKVNDIGVEFVITHPEDLSKMPDKLFVSGVHYRPKREKQVIAEIDTIATEIGKKERSQPDRPFYLSFHLDLLAHLDKNGHPSERQVIRYMRELNALATKYNIVILFENTAPRVDKNLPMWCYDTDLFMQKFGQYFQSCQSLAFNLDLAHLGQSDSRIFELLGQEFEGRLTMTKIEKQMTKQDINRLKRFYQLLNKTQVVHWSRTRGGEIKNRMGYKLLKFAVPHLPVFAELFHKKIYVHYQHLLYAHFPMRTDPKLTAELLTLFDIHGFNGYYVIESPAVTEATHFPNFWMRIPRPYTDK